MGLTTRDSCRIEPRGSNRRPAGPSSRFAPSPPAVATSGSGGGVDRGGKEGRRDWKRGNFEVGGTASHIGGAGQITGLPLYTCSAAPGLVSCVASVVSDWDLVFDLRGSREITCYC